MRSPSWRWRCHRQDRQYHRHPAHRRGHGRKQLPHRHCDGQQETAPGGPDRDCKRRFGPERPGPDRRGRPACAACTTAFFFCCRAEVTKYIDLEDTDTFIHCLHFYHPLGYWIDN